jgi:hypothetical protein
MSKVRALTAVRFNAEDAAFSKVAEIGVVAPPRGTSALRDLGVLRVLRVKASLSTVLGGRV